MTKREGVLRFAGSISKLLKILLLLGGCVSPGCGYLAQQGVGQLRLLHDRRKIADVLADPTFDERKKSRLQLAKEARDFGVEVLGLRGGDAYTRYLELDGKPVAWNVTAAQKDQLKLHVNRFPFVGALPYLGFFREADARKEAARLEKLGLDVMVRPVAGYSTLGVTSDPIYSSMLDGSPARTVEVVLHEMLHGTLYLVGKSAWNESLATFVGLHGAAMFFAQRGGETAARAVFDEAARRARDERAFSAFLQPVLDELRQLYASAIPRDEKLARREEIFAHAQAAFLQTFPPKPGQTPSFVRQKLNNAVLLSYAVYHNDTPAHQKLYERVGGDLNAFVRLYKYAVEFTSDPIRWLAQR
jgi:predicted aminopeptidase